MIAPFNYAIDVVFLELSRVRENDDFADESDSNDLDSKRYQQCGYEQQRSVSGWNTEPQSLDSEHYQNNRTGRKQRRPDEPEKPQGLLGEFHQEKCCQHVEKSTHVDAAPINPGFLIRRVLSTRDFFYPESLTARQQGQESMLITVQLDFIGDRPAQSSRTAAQVGKRRACQFAHGPVE